MKKNVCCILMVMSVVAVGCMRKRTASPHPWPLVNDTVDSLSQKLDYALYHHLDADSVGIWTAIMQEQARLHPDNEEIAGRAAYYEAMLLEVEGDNSGSDSILNSLVQSVDSGGHPYLFNRVAWHADKSTVRDVSAYDRIVARLDFFRSAGDVFLTGALYTDLGNLLKDVEDPAGAVAAYRSADSLYSIAGTKDIATFNRVNLASAHTVARDTAAGVEILKVLRHDEFVKSRRDIEELVLEKLFYFSHDTLALMQLYDMQKEKPGALLLLGMVERCMKRGEYARALELSERSIDASLEIDMPDFVAAALFAMSDAAVAMNDTVAAYSYLKDAVDLTDRVAIANYPDEIAKLETARGIASRRLEAELARSKATLRYVCVSFLLFLMLLGAAWIITARMQRLKTQRQRALHERDSMSRRLIATQVARSESERLISTVGKEIGGMADDGRLNAGETQRIVNAIKSHAVKQGERETFIETFGSMHPEFAMRLREINPAFTESDIRFASYIAMGLDTKHIADTMGVRPESVKQARWRLRTKMSLEKGDSLNDALRALLE